jgi:hypothetical protein
LVENVRIQPEQLFEVGGGLSGKIVESGAAHFGEYLRGMDDETWFVALAPMRYRREIWGIGFEEQAIGRRNTGGFANFGSFGKSGDTTKREMKPKIEAFASCF